MTRGPRRGGARKAYARLPSTMTTSPSCFALGFQRPSAARSVPRRQATSNILRVESALAERRRDATAHVVAVRAVHDDGSVGREVLRPLVDAIRVQPDRALHHVCAAREVMFGAGIDHLDSLVLHDLGRVLEIDGDPLKPQQTVAGRLSGHLILGRDMVRDAARELGDVNPELVAMLEHIVLTHLSLPEWGSPRLPLVPECLILHHADDLDAKLEMYARCLSRDEEEGAFTARDPVLGRQLFKGRSV